MKPIENWEERYRNETTGWDIGHISTPLKDYFDQLKNKNISILIPGGGNGYEAGYLYENGFTNIYLLDIAPTPLKNFSKKYPNFPNSQLVEENFFDHNGSYDLIVEQTFFCAINPKHRQAYAQKAFQLLKPKGKLVGLLWSVPLNKDHPPFGGNKAEYTNYFAPYFHYLHFENSYNSIKPRAERELFLLAEKKSA